MKRLRKTGRCVLQYLALPGILCFAIPGFAESEPSVPDNSVSIESVADTDHAATSASDLNTDTPGPATSADHPSTSTASAPDNANPSITLKGQVWRTKPGIVFLKTPIGLLSLSSKTTLKDLLASQEISFWVHNTHLAIDIRKRSDGSLVHRYLSGPFNRNGSGDNKLVRWTPEGEKSFDFGSQHRSLTSLQEGNLVTVEVDEAGTVLGTHDLQFDLQIGQIPPEGSGAHLLLTGTVAKLKSNFIFLRTPVGVVNVNTKIGITHVKVGQTLTLHIHGHDIAVTLGAPN